jgi:acyl-coenzyme A thioesterase PaaI-like protein
VRDRQVWTIELRRHDGKLFCVSTLTAAVGAAGHRADLTFG